VKTSELQAILRYFNPILRYFTPEPRSRGDKERTQVQRRVAQLRERTYRIAVGICPWLIAIGCGWGMGQILGAGVGLVVTIYQPLPTLGGYCGPNLQPFVDYFIPIFVGAEWGAILGVTAGACWQIWRCLRSRRERGL
jgi:hypothetical protein